MNARMLRVACAWLFGFIAGSALLAAGAAGAAAGRVIRVDCDHGGDLQAALRRAGSGHTTIRVLGTCTGSFSTDAESLEIVGIAPAQSKLTGGIPSLLVVGAGRLTLRNLGIVSSGQSLHVVGPDRTVTIEDCDIANNDLGIRLEHGAALALLRTRIHGTQRPAIEANGHSIIQVIEGSIYDNERAVSLAGGDLYLENTEVRGHQLGIYAVTQSTVYATRTTFRDNGGTHAVVIDRSRLTVVDSVVGGPSDSTGFSFGAGANSSIWLSFQTTPARVYGTVWASQGSNVETRGATMEDGVRLEDFSWIKLIDSTVEGSVDCQTGADAICAGNSTASVAGCGPVSATCSGSPVASPEAPSLLKGILGTEAFSARPINKDKN